MRLALATSLVCLTCAACVLPGCQASSEPQAGEFGAQASPREKFERVIDRFKELSSTSENVFRMPDENGHEQFMRVKVSTDSVNFTIHEPTLGSDLYTAEVTVATSTQFSALTPESSTTSPTTAASPAADEAQPLLPEGGALSEDGASRAGSTTIAPVDYEVNMRADRHIDTYDFAYRDGRWELVSTHIDDATRFRFEHALKEQ